MNMNLEVESWMKVHVKFCTYMSAGSEILLVLDRIVSEGGQLLFLEKVEKYWRFPGLLLLSSFAICENKQAPQKQKDHCVQNSIDECSD